MADSWIYRYEAKGIQSYVFGTNRLREIMGGSNLIEELPGLLHTALDAQNATPRPQILVEAAGTATVRFGSSDSAADFKANWPFLVSAHAPGLQISQAVVPEDSELPRALPRALAADRSRLFVELPEAGPTVARAPRTGLPAVAPDGRLQSYAKRGETLFDIATSARLIAAKEGGKKDDLLIARIKRDAPADSCMHGADFATEFDSVPTQYVAVVHADGNDMGRVVQAILSGGEGIDGLEKFSHRLSTATERAARAAIVHVVDRLRGSTGESDVIHLRPVVLGGDDLTAIVRADEAFEFTKRFIQEFEHETKGLGSGNAYLTATAGIAFVHPSYPFRLAYELAADLCRYTKSRTRGAAEGVTPSSVQFHRVTTALTGSFEADVLQRELRADPNASQSRYLTCGPYLLHKYGDHPTLSDLDNLRLSIKENKVPNSALREVIELMRLDLAAAEDRVRRLEETMTDPLLRKSDAAWIDFLSTLEALGCGNDGWQTGRSDGIGTPLLDALTWQRVLDVRAEG